MQGFFQSTVRLYHQALLASIRSFTRAWLLIPVLMGFALGLITVTSLIAPLGMIGGFILGALNALIIGATLNLTEQAVLGADVDAHAAIIGADGVGLVPAVAGDRQQFEADAP